MNQYKLYRENKSVVNGYLSKYLNKVASSLPDGIPLVIGLLLPSVFLYTGFFLFNYCGLQDSWLAPLLVVCFVLFNALSVQYLIVKKMFTANTEMLYGGLNIINLGVFSIMLSGILAVDELNYLIFASLGMLSASLTYYQQFKTGTLVIPRIGQTELLLLLALIIGLSNLKPAYDYYNIPIGSFILFDVVVLLTSGGLILFIVRLLKATKNVTYGVWLFIGSVVITTIFSTLSLSVLQSIIVITVYCATYVLKLKTATLLDGLERSAGLFTPLVLAAGYFMDSLYPQNTFIIVMAYLGFNLLLFCYRTLNRQKAASEEG